MEFINLEKLILPRAQEFYDKSLVNQRELVNQLIMETMKTGSPIVKIPFNVYTQISDEMVKEGWAEVLLDAKMYEEGQVSWFYPVRFIEKKSNFLKQVVEYRIISSEEFYKATLSNQRKELRENTDKAMRIGEPEVKLPYKAYPEVIEEMEKNGWVHGIWFDDLETKEPCSLFYPDCGYE